ncbi:MAG: hypothetical protein J5843_00895, partial [Clostridia bacterium]|nr:hypothetical protein [Clostridia bacterium]
FDGFPKRFHLFIDERFRLSGAFDSLERFRSEVFHKSSPFLFKLNFKTLYYGRLPCAIEKGRYPPFFHKKRAHPEKDAIRKTFFHKAACHLD